MDFLDELELFVNWDNAGADVGITSLSEVDMDPTLVDMPVDSDPDNIDLVLENDIEDDFSFCALQHFSENPLPTLSDLDDTIMMLPADAVSVPTEVDYKPTTAAAPASAWHAMFETRGSILDIHLTTESASRSSFQLLAMDAHNPPTDASSSNEIGGNYDVPQAPQKIGARFSRESVRILKTWLTNHGRHPYPSDEEREVLQRQTGLNKTQVTNWLANARRRGKVQASRSTLPHVGNASSPVDIPRESGQTLESMNPLQRWAHSPPENEPASASAIARAVTDSSSKASGGFDSPRSLNYTDDGSSASSLGTSQSSNGSLNSAYSHVSRRSWGSLGSVPFGINRNHRRRRRRATSRQGNEGVTSLAVPIKTFQCTFCTETFRTKHDWQRHEKSLHLSLERWVCAPRGPRVVTGADGLSSCVFCALPDPDDAHIEAHNYLACQERTLEERTFYRKDHLNQHLRLVHDVKFAECSMKLWKAAAPDIRSVCGFCGIMMETWDTRVDHLAQHFKTGFSMADWKGDWGFDKSVLDMVENSIPPCMHPLQYPLDQIKVSDSRNL